MSNGSPYIIRLSSRHGARGPVHNPTFIFSSPFRVPQGHQAVMKLSKFYFQSPSLGRDREKFFLGFTQSVNGKDEVKTVEIDVGEELRNHSSSYDLNNTMVLANVFQLYQVIGQRIRDVTGDLLQLWFSPANRSDTTYRDRTFRLDNNGSIGVFRDALLGSNGVTLFGFYSADVSIRNVVLYGPGMPMFNQTERDHVNIPVYHSTNFTTSQVASFTPMTAAHSPRYIRILCDKVAHA